MLSVWYLPIYHIEVLPFVKYRYIMHLFYYFWCTSWCTLNRVLHFEGSWVILFLIPLKSSLSLPLQTIIITSIRIWLLFEAFILWKNNYKQTDCIKKTPDSHHVENQLYLKADIINFTFCNLTRDARFLSENGLECNDGLMSSLSTVKACSLALAFVRKSTMVF